jgi:DNA-binding FrmR family transcriptional regulator
MNSHDKNELGSRMKRIAGQVTGIQRMLDENRPLAEVLTQLSAVRAALASAANIVLATHVEERSTQILATDSQRERRELVGELVRLFEKRQREG